MTKGTATSPATSQTADITAKITALLTPLASEDRQRVMRASFTLLGEKLGYMEAVEALHGAGDREAGTGGGQSVQGLPAKAASWMKTNNLTKSQLEQVFDIGPGGVEMIGTLVPGKTAKEKTINAYVLEGIGSLLATGEPSFDDKKGRKLCVSVGCFNSANHSVYMGAKGNVMSGSKDKGWRLTVPGLTKGAELVHEMPKGQ